MPKLWVHGHYKYFFILTVRGSTLVVRILRQTPDPRRRQILTTKVDPHTVRVKALNYIIYFLTHLKLCFATATHNLKLVKMYNIYTSRIKVYTN